MSQEIIEIDDPPLEKNEEEMPQEIVEIDGSLLEGGGQILRIALTLSAIKGIPIRVTNIRNGRSKPGLMEQHLKGVEILTDICSAKTKGVNFGSTEIEFWPQEIRGGYYRAQVQTAGSISLMLQVALPCTLFSNTPTRLNFRGGTNAEMAPQIDYTTEVFRPILEKFGATFDFELIRRGYFPKGGGEITVNVNPVEKLNPIDLTDPGKIISIYGWSFVAGILPESLSERIADGAQSLLKKYGPVYIERYKESKSIAPDNCAGIILVAETDTKCILGASALGKRSELSEDTGKKAAKELIKSIEGGVCVDEHIQDQIIILMALAKGPSTVKVGEITMHTKTAIFAVETLTNVKFEIIPSGSTNIIKCSGS